MPQSIAAGRPMYGGVELTLVGETGVVPSPIAMKISSIPQLYRNFNRSREIASVLSKYGLADWINRLDLEFAKELFKDKSGGSLALQNRETRIRLALTELGPTFIKLG